MGKIKEAVADLFPGLVPEDAYDDGYPDGSAGHVTSGEFIAPGADVVHTPLGHDIGFDGSKIEDRSPREGHEQVGTDPVNRAIDKVAKDSRDEVKRRPVTETADTVVMGNMTLPDTRAKRILIRNANRKQVTISNPGGTTVYVGVDSSIGNAPSPNVAYIPAGAARVYTHKAEIWAVGAVGGIVDWVEENYE